MERDLGDLADALFALNQAFFAATFVIVATRAARERRRSDLDVALLFGVIAVLLVLPTVASSYGALRAAQATLVTPFVLAVPYLMLRLVDDFASVPSWALRAAEAVFAAEVVAFLFEGTIPFPIVAAYAAIPIGWSSVAFVRGARVARGVTARRYTAIALGNAGAVACLIVVASSMAASEEVPALAEVVIQLGVLFAGACYFTGFATPGWLRRMWHDQDLRSFLARTPGLQMVQGSDALLSDLAFAVRDAIGSNDVLIGLPRGEGRLRFRGTDPGYEAPVDGSQGGRAMLARRALVSLDPARDTPALAQLYEERRIRMVVAAPIRIGEEIMGALVARSSHASLFARDDLEMCQLLADQVAFVLKNRALIEEREQRADRDPVTGLPSARVFDRGIEERLASATSATRFAVVLVRIDDLAEVSRTFGHVVGDGLLVQIAQRLAGLIGEGDLLTRWSVDQFAVLLGGADRTAAEAFAGRVLMTFERPFSVVDDEIECGVDLGIALHPDHSADRRSLVAAADIALGLATRATNAYAVYAVETEPKRARSLALRGDLRRAITAGGLTLNYQPLVSLRTRVPLRLEALVRWEHPDRGNVPPSEFVELAERTGLIKPLTETVLRRALADMREWRRSLPRLRVAVNISARMFADAGLVELVADACTRAGCDPDGLTLEITESILMAEPHRARETIARLRALGVATEIDDFGIGYSSLAYLQRLPVSGIKIDRAFIVAMAADERSDSIVRATIQLSHELGFEVVAEGIEDRTMWDLLVANGCDVGQGFFIAEPMQAARVREWLASWIARSRQAAEPTPLRPAREDGQRLILVVDDDPSIVSVIRDILKDHDYAVATASDGDEALAFVSRRRPHAVLLDVHMPRSDGGAFAQALRDRGIDIPIAVMTAGPNAERWAERLGAREHLAKPFGVDELLDVTGRVSGRAAA